MLLALMLLALGSVKLSAQSPPCSRKPSPERDAAERLLEVARLAGKHQRRIARELLLDGLQRRLVRVLGHLDDRLASPALTRPTLGHDATLRYSNFPCRDGDL